ncbi:MAG: L-ribulose-5-phosphate 3-epimerase [Synergistaceae bacterium]|jgi:predicted hexulose-6-phosphate isomerase|nr:L-ribulose-5-phosphate 3-epimerase [Synergistaceae bacterium]
MARAGADSDMRRHVSAYSLGLYEKAMPTALSWGEKLESAYRSGFDFLEISIDETDEKLSRLEWGENEFRELEDAMRASGCYVRSLCLSGHRRFPLGSKDKAKRTRSLDIMEHAVEFAWRLGIRVIQLAGYDEYYEEGDDETSRLFGDGLEICAEMAARRGVLLAFETMETPFMDTVAKAAE